MRILFFYFFIKCDIIYNVKEFSLIKESFMGEFFNRIYSALSGGIFGTSINVFDIIDVIIITIIIYQVLKFFKNTKAIHVLKGLAILVVALALAAWIGLPTTTWLLSSLFTSGILIIAVIFQPELRRALENLGRNKLFSEEAATNIEDTVLNVTKVCEHLSRRKIGALIVFEKNSRLNDIASTGTRINADVSAGLIENIFEPNTPLHDGALIISGNKIIAAGCFLPLSENNTIEKTLGTRHRAALGISEQTDSLTIVISEETGVISIAAGGELTRYFDINALSKTLTDFYQTNKKLHTSVSEIISRLFGKEDEENER